MVGRGVREMRVRPVGTAAEQHDQMAHLAGPRTSGGSVALACADLGSCILAYLGRPFSLTLISNSSWLPKDPPPCRPPATLSEGCHHCWGDRRSTSLGWVQTRGGVLTHISAGAAPPAALPSPSVTSRSHPLRDVWRCCWAMCSTLNS